MTAGARHERVRDLFLRVLGLVFLDAFLSLAVQVRTLVGEDGLLPAGEFLDAVAGSLGPERFHRVPSVFWIAQGDSVLVGAAWLGAALSIPLVLGRSPVALRIALWALYLSFASIGQDFLSFQWDNLLLEASFASIFMGRRGRPPSRAGLFLGRWLFFRLLFESGVSKLALGDPTWRDGTAMVAYFETAPIPTALGWWVHQLPAGLLRASAFLSLFAELVLPFSVWAPRRVRVTALAALLPFQLGIFLTANYGFFNPLSIVLHLFLLEDRDLEWASARLRALLRRPPPTEPPLRTDPPPRPPLLRVAPRLLAAAVVLCSIGDFALVVLRPSRDRTLHDVVAAARKLHEWFGPYRSVNSYHLFAQMTHDRFEVVIEGTADGEEWRPFELRWKPGDPKRRPPFVAPHQPRVDFQMWFLTLGGRAAYFERLLDRICGKPEAVRGLFDPHPFPEAPPKAIRVGVWKYTFTDRARRRETGEWWHRTLVRYAIPERRCGEGLPR
ncbi:MAG: lipase maturation factor family protein [Planctomycetota bacterium]